MLHKEEHAINDGSYITSQMLHKEKMQFVYMMTKEHKIFSNLKSEQHRKITGDRDIEIFPSQVNNNNNALKYLPHK